MPQGQASWFFHRLASGWKPGNLSAGQEQTKDSLKNWWTRFFPARSAAKFSP